MSNKNKRAQIFSTDLMIALSIAVLLFAASFSAWNKVSVRINENNVQEDVTLKAMLVSDILVKDSYAGIVSAPYLIDSSKLDELSLKNPAELNDIFNILPGSIYILLKEANGTAIQSAGSIGSGQASSVLRAVIYNNRRAMLEVRAYERQ